MSLDFDFFFLNLVQMSILDTLGEIITNRAIVLSPLHNETIFFGPLTHLLFMLSVTPDILPEHHGLLDHGTAQVRLNGFLQCFK